MLVAAKSQLIGNFLYLNVFMQMDSPMNLDIRPSSLIMKTVGPSSPANA